MVSIQDVAKRADGWHSKVNEITIKTEAGEQVEAWYFSPSVTTMAETATAAQAAVNDNNFSVISASVGKFLAEVLCNADGEELYDDYQALHDGGFGEPETFLVFQQLAMAIMEACSNTKKKSSPKRPVKKRAPSVK